MVLVIIFNNVTVGVSVFKSGVLFAFHERRDVVLLFQHEIAIVTEEGVEIVGPLSSETNWDIAHMVR